jgi:hypothetical protein
MRLSKTDREVRAAQVARNLLCTCGLSDALKIALEIRRKLLVEKNKRKGKR